MPSAASPAHAAREHRAVRAPAPESRPHGGREMQRAGGNQAAQGMTRAALRTPPPPPPPVRVEGRAPVGVQARLVVGAPGDAYEREADAVADRVMRSAQADAPHPCTCGGTCPACRAAGAARRRVQAKPLPGGGSAAPALLPGWTPPAGRPLDAGTRAFFEPRFGTDFGGVRAHTGPEAQALSQRFGARAFAYGRDIYFNRGEYDPESPGGRRLLAHELAHVVQQAGGAGARVQRMAGGLGGCTSLLSSAASSVLSGRAVHGLIEADFAARVPGALRVVIPGASAGPLRSQGICGEDSTAILPQAIGGMAGAGLPDLAYIGGGRVLQVAEIKPAAIPCLVDGEEQLLRYIDQGNARDPMQVAWRASLGVSVVSPMLPRIYPGRTISTSSADITTAWCNPGLLAYAVQPRRRRERVRERVRERERERVREPLRLPVRQPVTESERAAERQRLQEAAQVGTAVVVAGAAVVAGRALWPHFWRVVALRFAARAGVAALLAAADGPLPVGDLIAAGMTLFTIGQIIRDWNALWADADRLAAQEA
ncbi:MAG TPA: DUF4157 domain-containing protein [Longimicrobium sp.]